MANSAIAADVLRSFIERIERVHEERRALGDDISEIFKEAKGQGFDVKAMREVLRLRRMDENERDEFEAVVDMYLRATGDKPERSGTPRASRAGARAEAAA